MINKILLAFLLAGLIFCAVGCQTVQGVGRDITWLGEASAGVIEGE